MSREYTHIDKEGVKWRFEGSRPISELADELMDQFGMAEAHPECVRCGECCKATACMFGEWVQYPQEKQPLPWDKKGQCKFLKETGKDGAGNTLYECEIASEIEKDPTAIYSPAFGAGCCRSLFNEARSKILKERLK